MTQLHVGQQVSGILFERGVVIALDIAVRLLDYDFSGATAEAIAQGDMQATTPAAVVQVVGGSCAVYPQDEVFSF